MEGKQRRRPESSMHRDISSQFKANSTVGFLIIAAVRLTHVTWGSRDRVTETTFLLVGASVHPTVHPAVAIASCTG